VRPPARRYTLEQIVSAGRWAGASSTGGEKPDLSYDGQQFWQQAEGGAVSSPPIEALPQGGWWHANDCLCDLCRPRRPRA
jgi:hypothetical protein